MREQLDSDVHVLLAQVDWPEVLLWLSALLRDPVNPLNPPEVPFVIARERRACLTFLVANSHNIEEVKKIGLAFIS